MTQFSRSLTAAFALGILLPSLLSAKTSRRSRSTEAAPAAGAPSDASVGTKTSSSPPPGGKSAAPKTVITGDRMNLLQKGEAVEFVGGVKLVRGNDSLKADRMVSEEKMGLTRAYGNVYLRRNDPGEGVLWEAWADEGRYDSGASSGTLWGLKKPARVKRSLLASDAKEGRFEMESNRITFFQSAVVSSGAQTGSAVDRSTATVTFVEAEGRVYVRYEETSPEIRQTEVWANNSYYEGSAHSARFWGGFSLSPSAGQRDENSADRETPPEICETLSLPCSRQREGEDVRSLTGEIMTYFLDDKRLVVEKNVRAVILSPQQKSEKSNASSR